MPIFPVKASNNQINSPSRCCRTDWPIRKKLRMHPQSDHGWVIRPPNRDGLPSRWITCENGNVNHDLANPSHERTQLQNCCVGLVLGWKQRLELDTPGRPWYSSSYVSRPPARRTQPRQGIVLIAALLCLLVSSLVVANIFKTVRLQRQQVTRRTTALQATQLAQAGRERALARLSAGPAYDGEVWQPEIPFARSSGRGRGEATAARVQIAIEREDQQTLRVAVVAEFPFGAADQIRKSLTWSIPVDSMSDDNNNSNPAGGRP